MLEAERRQTGNVLIPNLMTIGAKFGQSRVHVQRVPEHDDVDHEAERAELIFLAFPVSLAQFTPLAMEYDTGELVAALAAIKLNQNAATIALVVDV